GGRIQVWCHLPRSDARPATCGPNWNARSLPKTNVWLVLLRGGGQHPGHQQDESQSQRKEFRLNQREHDAMPTLDYHNCKRLITAAPTPATTTHASGGRLNKAKPRFRSIMPACT